MPAFGVPPPSTCTSASTFGCCRRQRRRERPLRVPRDAGSRAQVVIEDAARIVVFLEQIVDAGAVVRAAVGPGEAAARGVRVVGGHDDDAPARRVVVEERVDHRTRRRRSRWPTRRWDEGSCHPGPRGRTTVPVVGPASPVGQVAGGGQVDVGLRGHRVRPHLRVVAASGLQARGGAVRGRGCRRVASRRLLEGAPPSETPPLEPPLDPPLELAGCSRCSRRCCCATPAASAAGPGLPPLLLGAVVAAGLLAAAGAVPADVAPPLFDPQPVTSKSAVSVPTQRTERP